jgi:hypothetical protein
MPAKPGMAIFDLEFGRHILPFPTECISLLKVPTHSVGTNTFLPGTLWTIAQTRCGRFKSRQDFERASLFRGAECPHAMGYILPHFHSPLNSSCRTPAITILSAFEPVENRTPARVLVSYFERESTGQILSNSVTFGRMRGRPNSTGSSYKMRLQPNPGVPPVHMSEDVR